LPRNDVWRIACILNKQNKNPYYLIAKSKPSPYDAAFDFEYFKALMDETKSTLNLKAFLATEQRIPGLGNGVLQDILFVAGLNPKRKLTRLISKKNKTYSKPLNLL
jgi:formamidopyrimidine-DNA glycosylase